MKFYYQCDKETLIHMIQKRKMTQHALQRIFVGKIQSNESGTIIHGNFRYPLITMSIFILLFIFLLRANTIVYSDNMLLTDKLIVFGFFAIMYIFIGIMFITGKTLFKKEEKDVIYFLNHILDADTTRTQGDGSIANTKDKGKTRGRFCCLSPSPCLPGVSFSIVRKL